MRGWLATSFETVKLVKRIRIPTYDSEVCKFVPLAIRLDFLYHVLSRLMKILPWCAMVPDTTAASKIILRRIRSRKFPVFTVLRRRKKVSKLELRQASFGWNKKTWGEQFILSYSLFCKISRLFWDSHVTDLIVVEVATKSKTAVYLKQEDFFKKKRSTLVPL